MTELAVSNLSKRCLKIQEGMSRNFSPIERFLSFALLGLTRGGVVVGRGPRRAQNRVQFKERKWKRFRFPLSLFQCVEKGFLFFF